ncbi:hypothetical protein DAI22_06g214703 [Oryza sativa Japonica Group]|nr:hypothetical protein DAI22_06g214703 [Oryza sativa Japonica Group]
MISIHDDKIEKFSTLKNRTGISSAQNNTRLDKNRRYTETLPVVITLLFHYPMRSANQIFKKHDISCIEQYKKN